MTAADGEAYCTLLLSDGYLPGAMVLAHSLRDNGTKKRLAVLVTLDTTSSSTIEELKVVYDHVIPVDRIVNKSPQNLYLMNRPDLASTFTKITLWRQTQFSHLIYIDADVVALRAPDELFKDPPAIAAVPDIGWPDCFNSGVLSLKPNMGDYYALLALAQRSISFDGADQGLLNMHFRDWERLSFIYNCTPSGNYQYVPAYRHFQSSISLVHYIGHEKPWLIGRDQKGQVGVYEELLGRWWAIYDKHFMIPPTDHESTPSRTVQQYVKGEESRTDYRISSKAYPSNKVKGTQVGNGHYKPPPSLQQRRYSIDWDPLHHAPPLNSRPEAANFPNEIYNMSADTKLFQPPSIPEPPKGMHYQLPKTPKTPQRLKAIFPWESTTPKATRVFPEDFPPTPSSFAPSATTDDSTQDGTESPTTPTIQLTSPQPFATYKRTNAWDEIPEIERYISNLPQNRRNKIRPLASTSSSATTAVPSQPSTASNANDPLSSPSLSSPLQPTPRRPSMKLTDFPTEIERPSLPVTPAPVHRPSFWGAERDARGDLPGAEGVPEQSEWDPRRKLEELQRRQEEVLAQGQGMVDSTSGGGREIPDRVLLGGDTTTTVLSSDSEDTEGKGVGDADPAPTALDNLPPVNMAAHSQPLDFSGGTDAAARSNPNETPGRREEIAHNEVDK